MSSLEGTEPVPRRRLAEVERDRSFPDWMRDSAYGKRFTALQHVLTRVPDEDYKVQARTVFVYLWPGPSLRVAAICLVEDALVFFASEGLEARPQEYANYAVAHEIAHVSSRPSRQWTTRIPAGTRGRRPSSCVGIQDSKRDELSWRQG